MNLDDDRTLYEVLGVTKSASQGEVKKAYHRLAMQLHPDKNPGDEQAHARFQTLQRLYSVLGDVKKRKVYDAAGSLEDTEALSGDAFDDLYSFYRQMFPKVTEEDIEKVEADYRGSEEESRELLLYYSKFLGDMQQVFAWQICCKPKEDSHRFMDAIDAAIEAGNVCSYPAYSKWAKATVKLPRHKNPLARKKKRKQADDSALVAQIRSRGAATMNSTLTSLEAKYGSGKSSSAFDEPSEAAFAAAASRMAGRNIKKVKQERASSGGSLDKEAAVPEKIGERKKAAL